MIAQRLGKVAERSSQLICPLVPPVVVLEIVSLLAVVLTRRLALVELPPSQAEAWEAIVRASTLPVLEILEMLKIVSVQTSKAVGAAQESLQQAVEVDLLLHTHEPFPPWAC